MQRVLWGSNLSLDFSHDALKDFFWVFVRVYGLVKQVKHASDNCALKASLGAEILAFAKKCAEKSLESFACRIFLIFVGKVSQLLLAECIPKSRGVLI